MLRECNIVSAEELISFSNINIELLSHLCAAHALTTACLQKHSPKEQCIL